MLPGEAPVKRVTRGSPPPGDSVILTPPPHGVLATGHDIFTLLIFTRNHFKLDGRVTHPVVS